MLPLAYWVLPPRQAMHLEVLAGAVSVLVMLMLEVVRVVIMPYSLDFLTCVK